MTKIVIYWFKGEEYTQLELFPQRSTTNNQIWELQNWKRWKRFNQSKKDEKSEGKKGEKDSSKVICAFCNNQATAAGLCSPHIRTYPGGRFNLIHLNIFI